MSRSCSLCSCLCPAHVQAALLNPLQVLAGCALATHPKVDDELQKVSNIIKEKCDGKSIIEGFDLGYAAGASVFGAAAGAVVNAAAGLPVVMSMKAKTRLSYLGGRTLVGSVGIGAFMGLYRFVLRKHASASCDRSTYFQLGHEKNGIVP